MEKQGATFRKESSVSSPDRLSWNLINTDQEKLLEVLSKFEFSNGELLKVIRKASYSIANMLPSFEEMLYGFRTVSPPLEGLERFNVATVKWEPKSGGLTPGAYRHQNFTRQYIYVDSERVTRHVTYEIAKIGAARLYGLRLHNYEEKTKDFVAILGCELPGLYRRALVSSTGELPVKIGYQKIYSQIPKEIALTILEKLYT